MPAPLDTDRFTHPAATTEVSKLLPLVYDELRTLADDYLRHERPDHTLQATALVHEAFLRIADQKDANWENKAQFFHVAATFMRRILVNHAIHHQRLKRGGAHRRIALDEDLLVSAYPREDLVVLDEALTRLARFDARKARIVELRYFAGLALEEVATAMNVSLGTVKRDWVLAKAWLLRAVREDPGGPG